MSLVDVPLFDLPRGAVHDPGWKPAEKLSADQKRTQRRAAAVAARKHPLDGSPLHPDAALQRTGEGLRCRGCAHVTTQGGTSGTYFKCGIRPITGGPGTDIRLWWPACSRWEAKA